MGLELKANNESLNETTGSKRPKAEAWVNIKVKDKAGNLHSLNVQSAIGIRGTNKVNKSLINGANASDEGKLVLSDCEVSIVMAVDPEQIEGDIEF